MRHRLRVPIRVKFMLTFLVLVTGVVGLITFSTASLFQDDKRAYVNGMTSMVAQGTAEEARAALVGYRERLRLYTRLLVGPEVPAERRDALSRALFGEFPELVALVLEPEGREPARMYNVSLLEAKGLAPESLDLGRTAGLPPTGWSDEDGPFVANSTVSASLPCFSMIFRQPAEDRLEAVRVVAVLQAGRLVQLVGRWDSYDQFLTDSEGGLLAHSDVTRILSRRRAALPPEVASLAGGHSASVTAEYARADGVTVIGGLAEVDFGRVLAGAEIPRSAAHLASRTLVTRLLQVAAVLLVLSIGLGFVWAHRITRPMERLSEATRTLAAGQFEVAVEVESTDEMGDLAGSFNQMAVELRQRETALRDAHEQLVHSEKMAAFGQLGAGIAHEVKNPLAGILGCAQVALDDAEPGSRLQDDLRIIEKEARRCKAIIDNLLKFARQEKAAMQPTDVNQVILDSLAILNHQLALQEVEVASDIQEDLPPVLGNANQLQQVLMNIVINAQQAMEGVKDRPRAVQISSAARSGLVEVRIADTGPGIPPDIRGKLFDPFFTTKPTGKGTGLGLSVSFGIIKEHGGEIGVETEIGAGTSFIVRLPMLEAAAIAGLPADL